MATTVEVMAEAFHEAGTPFIVGHPGGESVELMEAARSRGMRFILIKQESAGAMLAVDLGRHHRLARCLHVDAGPRRGQHGQRRHPCLDGPQPADRHHRPVRAGHLRDRPAPASRSSRALRLGHEVERHDRGEDRPLAASPGTPDRRPRRRQARSSSICPPPRPSWRRPSFPPAVPLLPDLPGLRPDRASLKPAIDMLATGATRRSSWPAWARSGAARARAYSPSPSSWVRPSSPRPRPKA